jgi:flagellar biosynthesis protein FlhF
MIVKSFIADSVAGALKLVRSELGGDAVILKTRKVDTAYRNTAGGRVEVTACVDQSQPSSAPTPVAPVNDTVPTQPIAKADFPSEVIAQKLDFLIDVFQSPVRKNTFDGVIGQLFTNLLRADVPENMAYDLAGKLSDRFGKEDDYQAVNAGAARMLIDQLPRKRQEELFKPGQRIILVGPPGSGKTSLMGRLAGHLISEKKLTVCLSSLDQVKVSAPEELQTYAEILNVDHFEMPREIDQSMLDSRGQDKVTLIDMPAMNPRHRDPVRMYTEKLARIKPHRVVGVFPALYRSSDLLDIIRAFKPLKLTDLAFTMIDQTGRLGGIIAMSIQTGLPITILGTGQRAGDIDLSPDLQKIIELFLGLEEGQTHE